MAPSSLFFVKAEQAYLVHLIACIYDKSGDETDKRALTDELVDDNDQVGCRG